MAVRAGGGPAGEVASPSGLPQCAAAVSVAAFVHHELALHALAPSDGDRTSEWSAALRQWVSSPLVGVGPDRTLVLQADGGSTAHFAHNESLQVAADGGLVGLGLLGLVASP